MESFTSGMKHRYGPYDTLEKTKTELIRYGNYLNGIFVKCDEELNTPDVIDKNELRARIEIRID